MSQPLSTLVTQLNTAGDQYKVPPEILLGVFGKETDFGKLVSTSTAGAVGYMQFLPSTAAAYNYPLTNTPTPAQQQQQFDAAAHYLSDLYKQYGSWDTALQHYSGGGYGLADVQAKAKEALGAGGAGKFFGGGTGVLGSGTSGIPLVTPAVNAAGSAASTIGSTASSISDVVSFVTSGKNWLRLGEVLLGALLLLLGFRALTGSEGNPVKIVTTTAARVAS